MPKVSMLKLIGIGLMIATAVVDRWQHKEDVREAVADYFDEQEASKVIPIRK